MSYDTFTLDAESLSYSVWCRRGVLSRIAARLIFVSHVRHVFVVRLQWRHSVPVVCSSELGAMADEATRIVDSLLKRISEVGENVGKENNEGFPKEENTQNKSREFCQEKNYELIFL